MKIPKDYVAIPVFHYEALLNRITDLDSRFEVLKNICCDKRKQYGREGYKGSLSTSEIATIIGFDLPEIKEENNEE